MQMLIIALRSSWRYILAFISGAVAFNKDEDDPQKGTFRIPGWLILILFIGIVIFIVRKFGIKLPFLGSLGRTSTRTRRRRRRPIRRRFRRFRRRVSRRFRRFRFRRY